MMKNNSSSDFIPSLWLVLSLVPLLMIISFFIFGQWTWGLMDDHNLALQAGKSGFFSSLSNIPVWLENGRGLRFSYDLYTQVFYLIFRDNPTGFYIFHALFFSLILFIWGYVAFLFTREILSCILVPAIALSCKPLYEGFFYLSVQELLGLFFLGCSLVFLIRIFLSKEEKRDISTLNIIGAWTSFIFTVGCKETFAGPLVVVLTVFFVRALIIQWRSMMIWMIGILIAVVGYAFWLKFFIQKGYSSSYSFSDLPHLTGNISAWFFEVFTGHISWLCLLVFLLWHYRPVQKPLRLENCLGVGLGLALYLLYWIMILPWRGMSYMAIPLAVFFGLTMAILLGPLLRLLKYRAQVLLVSVFLVLNILPAVSESIAFTQYNHDTIYFLKWIDNDPYIKIALAGGKHFGCNGSEASAAISNLIKLVNKKDMPVVSYVPIVRDIITDKDMLFYFYLRNYGDQDLSALGDMWTEVFVSENWIVFRRNY